MRIEYRRDWSDVGFFTKNDRPRATQNAFRSWNVHGGVEYQALGTTTEFNDGESSRVIG